MKRLIPFLVGLLGLATVCGADEPLKITLSLTNVATNTTATSSSTNTYAGAGVYGWINSMYIDLSGATSPDIDVDIKTGGTPDRTILSVDDLTADAAYAPQNPAHNTAGTALSNRGVPIPLLNSFPYLVAYDANKTNVNITVYLYVDSSR